MVRILLSIGIVGLEVETVMDVESDKAGSMWAIHRPTGRRRFRVLGVPMLWGHR